MRGRLRSARPIDKADLEAVLRRASLAGEHAQELSQNPDAMEILAGNLVHTLIAEEEDGAILGFCTVLPLSDTSAEVDALFVDPPAWRNGIGRMLITAAEKRVADDGVISVDVLSGDFALPFYEALGFQRIGVEATRFGPAVRLTKRLPAT